MNLKALVLPLGIIFALQCPQEAHAGWGKFRHRLFHGATVELHRAGGAIATAAHQTGAVIDKAAKQTDTNARAFWRDNRDWAGPVVVAGVLVGGCLATACTVDVGEGMGSIGLVAALPSDNSKSDAQDRPLPQPPSIELSQKEDASEATAETPSSLSVALPDVVSGEMSDSVAGINIFAMPTDPTSTGINETSVYVGQSIIDKAADEVAERILPAGGGALFSIVNLDVDLTRSPYEAPRTLFDFATDTALESAVGGEILLFAKVSAPETIATDPFDGLSKLTPDEERRARQQLDDQAARHWSPSCPSPLTSCARAAKSPSGTSFQ
jgi:hypothetical protein